MPLFKETWQYQSPSGGFWSEVYYTVAATLEEVAVYNEPFLSARLNLLHQANQLDKIRVSDVDQPRVAVAIPFGRPGQAALTAETDGPANLAEAVVLTLVSTVRPSSRKVWLRGIPESYISRDIAGNTQISPIGTLMIVRWVRALAQASPAYVVRTKVRKTVEDGTKDRVLLVDGSAGNGVSLLTTQTPHGLNPLDTVEITRAEPKTLPGLKGAFTALTVPTPTTFTLRYRTPADQSINSNTAFASKLEYFDDATLNADRSGFDYLGVRRSKNVATGSRGARRAASIRLQ